jgi:Glycosyl transferases group 1
VTKSPVEQPLVLSEFGGIACSFDPHTWGYSRCPTPEDFAERYAQLLETVRSLAVLSGFCYTQFADTFQEANGLLRANREPKFPVVAIACHTRPRSAYERRHRSARPGRSRRQRRPDWHLVFVGPNAKVDAPSLPRAANIHYLGAKPYDRLPDYIAGWDVALLPFARNDATRFISPTKTPEYLAAGRPVVSTSIRDVVRPYGQQGLARIADAVPDFVEALERALSDDAAPRLRAADAFLSHMSWDRTWQRMRQLIETAIGDRKSRGTTVRAAS